MESEVEGEVEVEEDEDKTFCVFWDLYPRKVGKSKAQKLWQKMNLKEQDLAIYGLKLWKQAEQWNRDDGKFIPYASTFLAQGRWRDEPWAGAFESSRADAEVGKYRR